MLLPTLIIHWVSTERPSRIRESIRKYAYLIFYHFLNFYKNNIVGLLHFRMWFTVHWQDSWERINFYSLNGCYQEYHQRSCQQNMQLLLWEETLRALHWLRRSLEEDTIKHCTWEFRGHSWLEHKSAATRGGYKGYWITLHANTLCDSLCPRRSLLPSYLRKVWWRRVSLGVLTTRGRVQVWPCRKRLGTWLASVVDISVNGTVATAIYDFLHNMHDLLQVIIPYSTTPC